MSNIFEYSHQCLEPNILTQSGKEIYTEHVESGKIIDTDENVIDNEDGTFLVSGTLTFIDAAAKDAYVDQIYNHVNII